MGMDPNGYPSHVPPIAPSKNAPFAYYNPGINYASTNPAFDINTVAPGNNLLVCGNPMIGNFSTFGNICAIQTIAGAPNPNYPCFPLKGGSIDQLTMNPEGFRLLDYNTRGTDPAGTTASAASQCTFSSDPNKGCDPTIIGDQYGDGTYAITDRFCVAPWRVHPEWMTAWEISQGCGGAPTGTELPNLNGCATQLAGLYNHYTDFFIVYKKVFEAFLVGLSDVVPTINLSVVAGPTSGGNINELVWNPDANGGAGGGDKRLSGNRLLFDGVGLSNAHLFV
ncbi:MAG: hypothetical protein KDD53_12325, partial [Bdellovibrionales bacterium]|nr:hypothetical protein [Bdellovibrionales bacterium]